MNTKIRLLKYRFVFVYLTGVTSFFLVSSFHSGSNPVKFYINFTSRLIFTICTSKVFNLYHIENPSK